MTVDDIRRKMPEEYRRFLESPVSYRIPGGESYLPVVVFSDATVRPSKSIVFLSLQLIDSR